MNSYEANFWDERYSSEEYVYGTEPNNFFKEQIGRIPVGKILLPGEGEGRNAVYAAGCGWTVDAVDQSAAGKHKAIKLAISKGVKINYEISDVLNFNPAKDHYDAAALIFFHIHKNKRKELFRKIVDSLKPKGFLIMELFDKEQLGRNSGGPQNIDMLYSVAELTEDLSNLNIIYIEKKEIYFAEGEHHNGQAVVIRFVGQKS